MKFLRMPFCRRMSELPYRLSVDYANFVANQVRDILIALAAVDNYYLVLLAYPAVVPILNFYAQCFHHPQQGAALNIAVAGEDKIINQI